MELFHPWWISLQLWPRKFNDPYDLHESSNVIKSRRVKEAIHKLYRCKGKNLAAKSLTKLSDLLALTKLKELKSLRKTLMSWREEILNYFENKLTNARTEGFNTVCKQLQRRSYGFRSFYNYRLRVLYGFFTQFYVTRHF